ncbi:MAG: PASTA domain-containing protein, partial [Synergistaceae bacterium]
AVFVEDTNASVPAVVGMNLVDAVDMLQKEGLLAKVDKVDSAEKVDTVVSQSLSKGEKVSRGKVILLKVSKGGSVSPVPDVRGLKFEDAVARLGEAGFKVDKILRVTDKLKPVGSIIAQNPSSPQSVATNTMVSLLVSSGLSGVSSFVEVPDLRGQNIDVATQVLEQIGLVVGATTEVPSVSVPANTIIKTNPQKRAKIPAGTRVDLVFARLPLDGETTPDAPATAVQDKEREQAVRTVVVRDTVPAPLPTKVTPAVSDKPASAKTENKPAAETKKETVQPVKETNTTTVKPAEDVTPKSVPSDSGVRKKTAKIRYQVPPLSKPLSLKIEIKDAAGTRTLKDIMAKSGEYISLNVPYSGDAVVTILLGGDFVWQDRFN